MIERSDTFIYGTVVGDSSEYLVTASAGNSALDEKREENGLGSTYEFYEYPISVISDTNGLFKKGEQITIAASKEFEDYNPHLSTGMEVVVPMIRDDEKATHTQFMVHGMYYVTGDGYVLSAYDEAAATEKKLSGMKVEALLREIEK